MKLLREMIRKIILEDKASFEEELLSQPNWDEGVRDLGQFNSGDTGRFVRARKRGRILKQTWAKHVDREFIDSLVYIHWNDHRDIRVAAIEIATKPAANKDEIACGAYLPGNVPSAGEIGNIGLLIKGYVTLVANDMNKVYSGSRVDTQLANPEMKNTSGVNRGVQVANADTYVLDRESFNSSRRSGKEAFVDNFEIIGIVCSPRWDVDREKAEKIQALLKKGGIDVPLLDPGDL